MYQMIEMFDRFEYFLHPLKTTLRSGYFLFIQSERFLKFLKQYYFSFG